MSSSRSFTVGLYFSHIIPTV